jgi:hypothetical protein
MFRAISVSLDVKSKRRPTKTHTNKELYPSCQPSSWLSQYTLEMSFVTEWIRKKTVKAKPGDKLPERY